MKKAQEKQTNNMEKSREGVEILFDHMTH